MAEQGNPPEPAADSPELRRQRAEERFQQRAAKAVGDLQIVSPEDMGRTLHELQVHQIELEMQNEELRRMQAELEAARARYHNLYHMAPVGYLTVCEHGLIIEANHGAAGMLGMAKEILLVKQPITRYIFSQDQDLYYLQRQRLVATRATQSSEIRMVKNDGTVFWVRLVCSAELAADGSSELRLVLSDITERKQADAVLRESESRNRALLNAIPDLIFVNHRDGEYVSFFAADPSLLHVNPAEEGIVQRNVADIMPEPLAAQFLEKYAAALDSGVVQEIDYTLPVDGREKHYEARIAPSIDDTVVTIARDTTVRKQAEEALRDSLEFSNNLIHSMQDGFSVLDPAGVAIEANPALCRMTGFSREELVGVGPPHPYWPPEEHERISTVLGESMKGGLHVFELTFMRQNGERFPVIVSPFSVENRDGTVLSYAATVRDITERKQSQEALAAERNLLHSVVNLLPTWVFVKDRESRFLLSNAACANNMGVASPEGLIGKTDADFYPPQIAEALRREEEAVVNGKPVVNKEVRKVSPNGEEQVLLVSKVPLRDSSGAISGLVGAGFDVTQLMQTAQALRRSEAFQKAVLDSLPAQIAVLDAQGTIVAVNEPWLEFAKINGNPLIEKIGVGVGYLDVCGSACDANDTYAKAASAGVQAVLTGKRQRFTLEYPFDSTDQPRWFAMEVVRPTGEWAGAIVAHTDISERRKAEEALRQATQKLRLHFEQTPLGVIEWDFDFRVVSWNKSAQVIFGYTREEAIGQDAAFLIAEENRGQVHEVWQALLKRQGGERSSNANLRKDGQMIYCEWYNTPLIDENGKCSGVASLVKDVSEQRQALHLLAWEKSALELIVSLVGRRKLLEELILGLESHMPGALCSILLLDEDGVHLRHGAAPSLPEAYSTAIDGAPIGPKAGSCGTAAYRDKKVIVSDIATDPLWDDYRELALAHDLRACWSTPIHSAKGKVLGTFAVYYRETRAPTTAEVDLMARAVYVIRIAIERKHAEEKIRQFNTGLEQRVAERTRELLAANAALTDFKAALDAHAIVAITDIHGKITYANDKFCEISKFSREELLGQDHRIINSKHHSKSFFNELWSTIRNGKVWHGEVKNQAKDRTTYWVDSTIVPFFDEAEKPVQFIAIRTDITKRKQAEEEIQKLNTVLINRAADLEAANKELEAFSYSVSHDLRAPLRAVDGFSRMVLEDYSTQLDADGQRMLGVIRSEAQRMARLIDDLLAFSRLGRQPVAPAPINMEAMALGVYDELAALESERKIRLDLRPLPPAYGTEAMIRQLWVNLIGNAIKFTKERETAEIVIGAQQSDEGVATYYVKDNGAGFDMRYANKLFGVFQRLHTQQEFPGTGVGLALVNRIVQRHGGRVWAEAEIDRGATIYFTLANQKP